jgi:hypothetical protein
LMYLRATGLWQRWRTAIKHHYLNVVTFAVGAGLSLLMLYMAAAPLPQLPVPGRENQFSVGEVHERAALPIEAYLEPLKSRDLFKPSAPVPDSNKLAKTTAEQLAQRLRFLGTTGEADNIAALVFVPERGPGIFRAGDRIAEFVLEKITKDSIVLKMEDEHVTLKR